MDTNIDTKPSLYEIVHKLLGVYSLEISTEENIVFVQSDNETIGIKQDAAGSNRLKVFYFSPFRHITRQTLEECPRSIADWLKELQSLKDREGYYAAPYFESTLSLEDALNVCSYLCSKMAENERKFEGRVIN